MRNLVTAMESYAGFDGDGLYTNVTASALADWGWQPGSSTAVQIVIEGDGEAWWAVGQDIHSGAREYTYTSSEAISGVSPGSVGVSAPQPLVAPSAAGVAIRDVGQQIDIEALAQALLAGGVLPTDVCAATTVLPGSHELHSTATDETLLCDAAAVATGATMRTVLGALLKAGGRAAVAMIALEFVGDGSRPASTPPRVGTPEGPATPRPVPPTLPDEVWKVVRASQRMMAENQVDAQTAVIATRQCLETVANAMSGADPYQECSTKPVFLSGQADVKEATDHDIEALTLNPAWVQLNYRARANNPSKTWWKDTDPICLAKVTGQACDEFPGYATLQGGGLAVPRPSLKAIDFDQNSLQGSKYNTFLGTCHVAEGEAFLWVPVPREAPSVSTLAICNGH
ncbi:MAG: NucA/NucB deoxyribonuclease domain-containing protein [Cellulomonas sp.]